ncbi:leucine rich repeat protein [Leptospira interrogans serovar Pyrogenes str. L0374]|uniref:Leucine rich repeat protein n=1 Tax=Leptospira interrogans serovar Pyrogenes str. L0374 TaxID=1049928 RepID=M6K500_LEPIR|nr:leucine rich repeat protein [Leptospira interrogans serovar Pyrogenes str. L0374]
MKIMNLQKIGTLIFLCFLSQLKAEEKGHYQNLTKALKNPTDVQTLDLSNNQLITLPKEIGQLKELEWLSLSKNQLKTLPKEIETLKKLEELFLDDIPVLKSQEKRFRNYFPRRKLTLSK